MADNSDNADTFWYDMLWYGAASMNSSLKPQKYGFIHWWIDPGLAQLSFTRNGMDVLKKEECNSL